MVQFAVAALYERRGMLTNQDGAAVTDRRYSKLYYLRPRYVAFGTGLGYNRLGSGGFQAGAFATCGP
ncbi:MAG: hypothetical protein ACLQOO_21760 [Terriglobia bacterium]